MMNPASSLTMTNSIAKSEDKLSELNQLFKIKESKLKFMMADNFSAKRMPGQEILVVKTIGPQKKENRMQLRLTQNV